MRAVILSGGQITDYSRIKPLIRDTDTIICADSGYDHAAAMGLSADALLGDFDSISKIPEGVKTISYPAKKNFTDTELAAAWAKEQGYKEYLFLGATGRRMDHTLANLYLAAGMSAAGLYCEIADEYCRIIPIKNSSLSLDERAGTTVSLIPLEHCRGISNENMEYPLQDAELLPETTRGISNVITKSPAGVSVRKGLLLVILVR